MTTTEIKTPAPKNLTRRKMLQSVAVVAAVSISSPTSAAEPIGESLVSLIDAQKLARAASDMAWDKQEELSVSFRQLKAPFVLVPFGLTANGESLLGSGEFSVLGEAGIRERIASTHANLRKAFSSTWARASIPEVVAVAEQEIEDSEERAIAALVKAVAEERERYEASGVRAAELECEPLDQALRDAIAAVMAYRPRSPAEVATKIEWYIAESVGFEIDADDLWSFVPEVF